MKGGCMMEDGTIITKQRFPSPHPNIRLFIVTYLSQGLKVKGLLAEPDDDQIYDGFLYLRGGIKNVGKVRPSRIVQFAAEGFIVFAPYYRGNQGGEGDEDFAGEDRADAIAGFALLEQHKRVNPDNIHIFGFSRGELWLFGRQFIINQRLPLSHGAECLICFSPMWNE